MNLWAWIAVAAVGLLAFMGALAAAVVWAASRNPVHVHPPQEPAGHPLPPGMAPQERAPGAAPPLPPTGERPPAPAPPRPLRISAADLRERYGCACYHLYSGTGEVEAAFIDPSCLWQMDPDYQP